MRQVEKQISEDSEKVLSHHVQTDSEQLRVQKPRIFQFLYCY